MKHLVVFKTTKESSCGRVAVNPEHVASVFARDGDKFTSIVMSNSIGYQVDECFEDVMFKLKDAGYVPKSTM